MKIVITGMLVQIINVKKTILLRVAGTNASPFLELKQCFPCTNNEHERLSRTTLIDPIHTSTVTILLRQFVCLTKWLNILHFIVYFIIINEKFQTLFCLFIP